jgi:hypothetical protein
MMDGQWKTSVGDELTFDCYGRKQNAQNEDEEWRKKAIQVDCERQSAGYTGSQAAWNDQTADESASRPARNHHPL